MIYSILVQLVYPILWSGIVFCVVAVAVLALSKEYDLSARNVLSIVIGGTIPASTISLPIIAFNFHSSINTFWALALAIIILAGPILGCYFGLKLLGIKSHLYKERDKILEQNQK